VLNIITALYIEAKPIIKKYNLKPNGEIYQNNYINLTITGQGKIKSAINTALLLSKQTHPSLNLGICGSSCYDVGEGFFIHKITDTDTGYDYYPDFFDKNSKALHTVSKLQKLYPLTDMEASGFFEACYKFLNVDEIAVYKIVSDNKEKKPKKEKIPSIIASHIHIVDQLLEAFSKKSDFFKEIEEKLKEAELKMHLTNTQKSQLKNLFVYYKTKGKKLPQIPKLEKKEEVKRFITSLFS